MLIQTPGIVLRHVDFSESSRIITIFTRDYGKIAVMVKGFRRAKSRYAGIMAYGSILDLIIYYKQTRSVQTLKEADVRIGTVLVQSDFIKLSIAMALLELADLTVHEHEPNEPMYDFLETFIQWLNQSTDDCRILFPYLQMRVAELSGVGLQFDATQNQGDLFLNIISGSISDYSDEGLFFKLKPMQKEYMHIAMQGKTSRLLKTEISTVELKNLINHLDVYLKHHIDGLRDRKTDAIFEQILD